MYWEIVYNKRGWSLNAERTWHYHKRNKQVEEWRTFFRDKAIEMGIPQLARISVDVYTTFGTRALQDPANNMPAVKAAIDGLTNRKHKDGFVGAGVIEDDSAEYVASITFWAPTYEKGNNSVCLRINAL